MKRQGNLFLKIIERDNLLSAFRKAARGKAARPEVVQMRGDLDAEIQEIGMSLRGGTAVFGAYRQFLVHDPKCRVITAPSFSERVIHHAIMNVCEPYFDRWLIDDTFACRGGKGREAAVRRANEFAGRFPWSIHLDVRQFFDSICHETLLSLLARRFKDRQLLGLFREIVCGFRGGIGRGLPIGSLTSQHFANFYLGWLDRFVKETLRVRGYVRYMDDIVLWGDSRQILAEHHLRSEGFLGKELGLCFKPAQAVASVHGLDFLGCRIFPTHVALNRRSRRRFRRRVRVLLQGMRLGVFCERDVQRRLDALIAFSKSGDTRSWRFRQAVVNSLVVGDP